jgi:hypothetical protein
VAWREDRVRFWAAIRRGASSEDAGCEAGVSQAVGTRWFRQAGGVAANLPPAVSGRYLSFAERENRLVVRQLERDWEAALAARQQLLEDYQRFTRSRPVRLTAAELAAIHRLARDIPALWRAPSTTHADRKRLLRCVIDQVEVTAQDASEKVRATIAWAGGSRTTAGLVRPVAQITQLSYYPQLVQRLRELAGQGLTARAIAGQLAAENLRPPRQQERFNDGEILQLLHRHGLRPAAGGGRRAPRLLGPGEWWLADLAREIGMPAATLFGWLQRGWVTGRQEASPPRRWVITADSAEVERLRALHRLPAGYHNRRRWAQTPPGSETEGEQPHEAGTRRMPH